MSIGYDPISPKLSIPAGAFVLEIGSGHNPHPRADILCDRFLESDAERPGSLVIDRPLIQADAQLLPFRPHTFDYIIARHVLEHVEEPGLFFGELMRVGSSGYIETPSMIWERLHPARTYHRWYVLLEQDTILMIPKPSADAKSALGVAMDEVAVNSLEYTLLEKAYRDLFYVRHEWSKRVKYHICEGGEGLCDAFRHPWDRTRALQWIPQRTVRQQAIGLLGNIAGSFLSRGYRPFAKLRAKRDLGRRQKKCPALDLASLMMCPECQSLGITMNKQVACCDCGWQTAVILPE